MIPTHEKLAQQKGVDNQRQMCCMGSKLNITQGWTPYKQQKSQWTTHQKYVQSFHSNSILRQTNNVEQYVIINDNYSTQLWEPWQSHGYLFE